MTTPGISHEPYPDGRSPTLVWETPRGTFRIFRHATLELIASVTLDAGLGLLFRPSRYREEFLHTAQHPGGNVILALAEQNIVVGHLLVEQPVPVAWQRRVSHNRWAECPAIVELTGIEVSQNYRRLGVAEHLLAALADDPAMQDKIIMGTIMRRYWDLADTGLTAWQYRAALVDLLGRFGFEVFSTDDPRVITEPTDALLARIGLQAAPVHVAQFHRLRHTSSSPA